MAEVIKLQEAPVPRKDGYVLTPTGADVFNAFDLALNEGKIVLVIGESGRGKSSAIAAYIEGHPRAATVWVRRNDCIKPRDPDQNARKLLRRIAEVVSPDRPLWNDRCEDIYNQVVERLRGGWRGSCDLLIVDEAQRIDKASLQVLRDLNHESGVGIALVGEPQLGDLLRKNASLAALQNRIAAVVHLGLQPADVAAFFAHHGLPTSALKAVTAFAMERSWHKLPGLIQTARDLAGEKPVGHAHLMRALELCGGR